MNAKGQGGWTPLHNAAGRGNAEAAEALIASGADVSARNRDGGTPLHAAAFRGHAEVAELLIAKGAHVNARTNKGKTALTLAGEIGSGRMDVKTLDALKARIREVLLKHGATE